MQYKKSIKYEIDMCSGSILKKMLLFSIPLMFSSILQLLFNAADVVVVGKFAGDNSLAAVGSNGSLINLMTNLFVGLSIGTNVLVARYYSSKKEEDLKKTIHTSIMLSIISGFLLMIIGLVFARKILVLMQSPPEVLDLAVIYLRIYFIGMPAIMIYNFGSAILRAIGDTKRPLYYLALAGIVNVVLNLFLVIVFKLDVAGVAIATVISQCISAYLVIRCLMKEEGAIRLNLKNLNIDKEKFLKILQIGLPAGFQGIMFSISNVIIQSSVNTFGEIVVAGNSAASNIEGFVYMGMNAFYQACISFVSQNLGAGQYKRINRIVITAVCCAFTIGAVFGNLVVFFGQDLLGIYSNNPEVITAGMERLKVIASTYALCGIMDVMVGGLRGLGYSVVPMIVSIVGVCLLRLAYIATIFQIEQFHTIRALYMTYPISWALTFCVHLLCFIVIRIMLGKKWKKQIEA